MQTIYQSTPTKRLGQFVITQMQVNDTGGQVGTEICIFGPKNAPNSEY